jgi:MerR family transcriptional regulator, light-induced transcriptional regulator
MGKYSIKELEQLSGIKAHTIRIWEKRYNLITPQRTTTNIRFYSDEDLKKIINISLLNHHGIKISKVASMSLLEIHQKILEITESASAATLYMDQLVVAMVDLDEAQFEKMLTGITKQFGFEQSITEVIYPFLEKIGVLWQTGTITPAHEHFISNLIRQKLIVAIASLPVPSKHSKKVVLFLAESELHELGLLFFHYMVRSRGFNTIYLGQSVPYQDLKTIYDIHKPEILITSLISSPPASQVQQYINKLSSDFQNSTIYASGLLLRNAAFHIPKNVKVFYRASELPALLKTEYYKDVK